MGKSLGGTDYVPSGSPRGRPDADFDECGDRVVSARGKNIQHGTDRVGRTSSKQIVVDLAIKQRKQVGLQPKTGRPAAALSGGPEKTATHHVQRAIGILGVKSGLNGSSHCRCSAAKERRFTGHHAVEKTHVTPAEAVLMERRERLLHVLRPSKIAGRCANRKEDTAIIHAVGMTAGYPAPRCANADGAGCRSPNARCAFQSR